jgi:protein TonB
MRSRDIFISTLGHAALAVLVLAWPMAEPPAAPRIYEVALADMAPARAGASAPPAPQAAQPAPPKPTPHKTAPPPVERVISAKKAPDANSASVEQPAPQPSAAPAQAAGPAQSAAGAGGTGGPQMRSYGGVSAYDANSVDERPSVLRGAMPEYPPKARRMHQEGRVLVRVVVDEQGSPVNVLVQEAAPAGVFDQAALSAAKRFRFLPGKIAGRRVMTAVLIPFEFTLR